MSIEEYAKKCFENGDGEMLQFMSEKQVLFLCTKMICKSIDEMTTEIERLAAIQNSKF